MMDSYENLNACQINLSNHLNHGTLQQSKALYEQLNLRSNDHDENPLTERPQNQIKVKKVLF